MTRPPQLTNDARAVLLAAQLPDQNNDKGHIREHGDVRRTQLVKGGERLELMGYVQPGTFLLTGEGEALARKLQENEARLSEGIPFVERIAAISLRGGRETSDVLDEWQTFEFEGGQLFTNGHLMMLGQPPSDNPRRRPASETTALSIWYEMLAGNPQPVRPVAYTELQTWKHRQRLVWFSDKYALDGEIYSFITSRFPIQKWTHSTERDETRMLRGTFWPYAFNAYSNGRRVAVAMTYNQEPTDTVLKLIEEAASARDPKEGSQEKQEPEPLVLRPFNSGDAVQLGLLEKAA